MKKYSLFLVVALLSVMSGCKKDSKEDPVPVLSLVAPAAAADIDLNGTSSVTFSWKVDNGAITGGYTLYLSVAESLSNPATFTETNTSREFSAANLDAALGGSALGLAAGEQKTVYWSVKPSAGSQKAVLPETRSLTVTRIAVPPPSIAPQLPSDALEVNATSFAFPLVFQWQQDAAITAYTLKISTASNFPATAETVTFDVENAGQKEFTSADYDALLESLGLDFEAGATLYWTVVPTDESILHATDTRTINATRKPADIILLTAPANAFEIDAELEFIDRISMPLAFTWEKLASVSAYTLKISLSESMTNPVVFDMGDAAKKVFTDETFDDLLEELGVAYGATAPLYWTVEPATDPGVAVSTQKLTLTAKRWNNTVLVGTFAGSGTQLGTANMPAEWVLPPVASSPNVTFNEYTEGSLGTLKTAHLNGPIYMALDGEGNMLVVNRNNTVLGIVKINEAENEVEVVAMRTLNSWSGLFQPNDIIYDAQRDRFIMCEETNQTLEHFYTLDKENGRWKLNHRKASFADRGGLAAVETNTNYAFDESGKVLVSSGAYKHSFSIHQNGYIYGHANTHFYRMHPETFAGEMVSINANTLRAGQTKHLAFDPKNPDHLWYSSYTTPAFGLNYMDVANESYVHLTSSTRGYVDGPLASANFQNPRKLIFDKNGDNLYMPTTSHVIRKVDITTSTVSTLAGAYNTSGYVDGEGTLARFNGCAGGCLSPGEKILYIGDPGNHRIRKIRLMQ
ncbi:MAG: SusE domain-containing protein [Bacteroidales bacterium]|jgi:hypothetical protein|nr:SusE domain-containing protein [Bacteroidales bacterium]